METLGTFKDVETATRAVDSLIKAGFAEETITSLTSVPYPDGVIVKTDQRTWFRWMSVGGGMFGAGAGFLLAAGTAYLYPVQTGDKPIIAYYPDRHHHLRTHHAFCHSGRHRGHVRGDEAPSPEGSPL